MNNIYIDCGANLGQGYERLKSQEFIKPDAKIYMFEPLKNAYDFLKKTYSLATIFNSAVWIENKDVILNIETADTNEIKDIGHASNIIGDKFNFKNSSNVGWKTETVKAIDLTEFIINNFEKNDNIFIKFDIEGAEYEILDKIIETKTYEYFKMMNIEFHENLRNDKQNLKPNEEYTKFLISKGITIIYPIINY